MNNYLSALKRHPSTRDALLIDDECYSYHELLQRIEAYRNTLFLPSDNICRLHPIMSDDPFEQLVAFLACSDTLLIPVILPESKSTQPLDQTTIPANSCMAVCTSGSGGTPKLLYRSFTSWFDFFPTQNQTFLLGKDTRLFLHGSLAFTGTLNFYLSQLSCGGTIITSRHFDPRLWQQQIKEYKADAIYLIPVKLRPLLAIWDTPFTGLASVIAGSQTLSPKDVTKALTCFPNSTVFLYYGASELSYVTYATHHDLSLSDQLIGRPFSGVSVTISDRHLLVDTPYAALGLTMPYLIGDLGHQDEQGRFYFDGRSDDLCKINGVTVSLFKIERALEELPGVMEAAVIKREGTKRDYLEGYITIHSAIDTPETDMSKSFMHNWRYLLVNELHLSVAEIPKEIHIVTALPKTAGGKIKKGQLTVKEEN